MSYTILVADDEPAMAMGLRDNLEFEGYEVTLSHNGAEALDALRSSPFDLAILDVMMPKMSGFDVCKTARAEGIATPIIMLTAKGEEIDRVLGLELGADDYLTKPFSLRELLARVKAVLRRSGGGSPKGESTEPSSVDIGELKVDFKQYRAEKEGTEISMTQKEFELLKLFHHHPDEVISRDRLLADVWGYEDTPTTRTVDNFILKLRQKLEPNPSEPRHLLTVYGVGYKFVP